MIEVDTEMTTRVFSSISRPGRSLHEPHCRGRSRPETVVFPAAAFVLAVSVFRGVSVPRLRLRRAPLRNRNFRRFFVGYSTSLLGTGMAPVAVAFAVLNNGGTATDLGFVISVSVLMTVICLPLGGVVADRFGRRAVMLGSDTVRSGAQGAFAALVLIGHPPLLALVGASAVGGAATGFFSPALTALPPSWSRRTTSTTRTR